MGARGRVLPLLPGIVLVPPLAVRVSDNAKREVTALSVR